MKRMLMQVTAIISVITLAVCSLCSCGTEVNDKDEQGRTIVSVGNWPSREGKTLDDMNARKARFEEANPDISIVPDEWAWDRKTFYAKAAGGQLPIVYQAGFTEIPEIINSELSADLSKVLSKRGYDGMLNNDVLEVIGRDGKIFAFPNSVYILGLSCNTDLMEKAGLMEADGTPKQPKDWYEVAEFAVKIKEATGKPGFIIPTSGNAGGWMFTPIAWSFGVDFMEKGEDGKWKATFNTPEAEEALQWVKDLKWKYDVLPSSTLVDLTEYYKTYAIGNAGMLISPGDINGKVTQYNMDPEHIGIMAMPQGPKRHVTLLGGGVYLVNANATEEQIDGAIRWLETAYSFKASEEFKTNTTAWLEQGLEQNRLVGISGMSPWSAESEAQAWSVETVKKLANANPNHVKLYNDFAADCPAEIQPEEPVCCQELYGILDNCIQQVLTDKNADCKAILEKANADFQVNYLDNITY